MAFIPTPNAARVALRFSLFNQDVVNTLWFRKDIGIQDPALAMSGLAVAVANWWEDNLQNDFPSELTLEDVTATSQVSSTAPSVTEGVSLSGTLVGTPAPGNVCITIKFNTAQRGRSGRGRNYLSALSEGDITGNQLSQVRADAFVSAYNQLIVVPPDGWEWVVVSHYLNLVERTEGFAQTILSASIVDLNLDSQRRRLTGRGN